MKFPKSVVIIAKGPSVHRSTKEWIDQFEKIAIINHVPFEGFEDKIGNKAHYWFRNWQCRWYPEEYLKQIELECVVNTSGRFHHARGKSFRDLFPKYIKCDFCHFKQYFKELFKMDPPSGLSAIEYFIKNGFQNIGFVGIDLYQVGQPRYYVDTKEFGLDPIQKEPSLHDANKSLNYIHTTIKNNPQITFHIISDADIKKFENVIFYN